jgi:hypothetical protein
MVRIVEIFLMNKYKGRVKRFVCGCVDDKPRNSLINNSTMTMEILNDRLYYT